MKTKEMEYALYKHFFNSYILITTNITSLKGFFSHECDLLMVSKSRILTEVEIKVSKSDLKADMLKTHQHKCSGIKRQYFAIPSEIADDEIMKLIPENFGVLIVTKTKYRETYMKKVPVVHTSYRVREVRRAPINENYDGKKINDSELLNLHRLASYRYWTGKLRELKSEGLYEQYRDE